MKLVAGILLIHKSFAYADQSTQVPSDYPTILSTQSTADITDPTSAISSTPSTSTQENSDSINRGLNTRWENYNPWRPSPVPTPIFIPTISALQPIRRKTIYCGQTWISQDYQVSDHDHQGKCKNCNRIHQTHIETVEPWKVVHGKNALPGEVPWNIEIYYRNNFYKGCGGTLISASKILSAAHCFHKELRKIPNRNTDYVNLLNKYHAVAGLTHRNFWRNSPDMQTKDIVKIAIPREYKGHIKKTNKKFDIAVLIVRQPFLINEYVTPACLPTSRLQMQNGLGVISGLGVTDPFLKWSPRDEDLSEHLKRAEIKIIPGSKCRKEMRKIDSHRNLWKSFNGVHMLCGLGKRRNGSRIDSCQGDSGGPLVVKINNAYTVVGVISWGVGPNGRKCGGPGAYSKVSKYLNFINRIN